MIMQIKSYFEFGNDSLFQEVPRQVQSLASKSLDLLIHSTTLPEISHLIIATSCPDRLAPSIGQCINQAYYPLFANTHVIDIVQGCAGGATALILGSQLSKLNQTNVIVIQADAGKKATSSSKLIHKIFGNGSSACLISEQGNGKGLLHYKSKQYKDLHEIVTVNLGHDADAIIKKEKEIKKDPRKFLGLDMKSKMALKLFSQAEGFFKEFVEASSMPDMLILHQVNPIIIKHLSSVFSKYKVEFVNVSAITGNCGAASVGIALDQVKDKTINKKVMICSFGTGGVITAGMWQM